MKKAFTLIELLVVIAIIAILAAILFPVFAQAKLAAKQTACLSNGKQLGVSTKLYQSDYDDTMPLYYAYNTLPTAWVDGHKGVEVLLYPYNKSKKIFRSPLDQGGPALQLDVTLTSLAPKTYAQAYGSSYKFTTCMYSVAPGESIENNGDPYSRLGTARAVTETALADPANSRIMRSEMFPWFGPKVDTDCSRYAYSCPAPYFYYQEWNPKGGTVVFADGHAKTVVSSGVFDQQVVDAEGHKSGEANTASFTGTWYGVCD